MTLEFLKTVGRNLAVYVFVYKIAFDRQYALHVLLVLKGMVFYLDLLLLRQLAKQILNNQFFVKWSGSLHWNALSNIGGQKELFVTYHYPSDTPRHIPAASLSNEAHAFL